MTGAITAKESEHEHCTMDHSGTARRALSVRRWYEAGHAARGDDEADADCTAGLVRAFYRNRRGVRRDRTDPPLALGDTVGSHTAGRRWSGDRNDRCDSVHTLTAGQVASALMPLVVGLLCAFVAYGRGRLTP